MKKNELNGTKSRRSAAAPILISASVLAVVFLASFCIGRYGVPLGQLVKILFSRIFAIEPTWTAHMEVAVLNIRLPRIVMACLVGAALSAAGASYQGVFQNPMAAPDILGASSGAALGAAFAILVGASSRVITLTAFIVSLATVCAVFFIARRAPGMRVVNLILAGIMISSLCSAGTSYIKLVADPSDKLPAITYWLMGSLSGLKNTDLLRAFIPIAAGLIPLLVLGWRINLLTLGDEEARAMGVNADALRFAVIVCATLITAASVSVCGVIGWVGLVIPHLCRRFAGSDYSRLLPVTMIVGATFMLLVDDISRNLLATEIPIGILTAVVGAPFFIYLISRRKQQL